MCLIARECHHQLLQGKPTPCDHGRTHARCCTSAAACCERRDKTYGQASSQAGEELEVDAGFNSQDQQPAAATPEQAETLAGSVCRLSSPNRESGRRQHNSSVSAVAEGSQ